MEPADRQLIQGSADGEVVHNDDTAMRVLELMGKKQAARFCRRG